jgi:hypothetical protein
MEAVKNADAINRANVPYNPLTMNSNTFAHDILSPFRPFMLVLATLSCGACGPDIGQLEQAVKSELRPGTPATRVVAFLDARRIEHSDHASEGADPDVIGAIVRDTSWYHLFARPVYQFTFFFDRQQRLIKYEMKKDYIAL